MEMRERRWEEMDVSCLARIFARLGPEDKVLSLPFVCKSWYRVLLEPLCWQSLNFASSFWPCESFEWRFRRQYPVSCPSFSGLLKLALHRSQGSTTQLWLPRPGYNMYDFDDIHQEDLELVEKGCLGIKIFSYATMDWKLDERISKMVANWKNLETLSVRGSVHFFGETLAAIKEHCPRFGRLLIADMYLGDEEANAIVTFLPRLKRLALSRVFIDKKYLIMSILDGCKELEELRIKYCWAFLPDDDVMKRAAAIRTFLYENPTYEGDDEENSDDGYEV